MDRELLVFLRNWPEQRILTWPDLREFLSAWRVESVLCVLCAGLCFASFAWGMIRHFRRLGSPSRTMIVTALLGAASAALQIIALERRRMLFPAVAFLLYGASMLLFWWAVRVTRGKLAACGQGSVSQEIVTAGPYRYVRHPFYTSYNLTWIAGFSATGWWPLAIAAMTMASLYERAAREEELGFSVGALADAYALYKGRTGKYLPRLGIDERPISTGSGRSDRSGAQNPNGRGDAGT